MSKKLIGKSGEDFAEKFLKEKAFKILGRNLMTRLGEIDIVALKGERLHFVEVRLRQSHVFGSALDSISREKLQKMLKATTILINNHKNWGKYIPCLSLVTIDGVGVNKKIEFFEDIWLD